MSTRNLVLGTLLAALTAAALPATAAAAPSPAVVSSYTLSLQLWDCYAQGGGAIGNANLKVTLRRGTTIVATTTFQAGPAGQFTPDFCVLGGRARIRPGDTLTVFRTRGDQRTFTIPDVAPRIDVGADTASGTTPPGTLSVSPQNCTARELCLLGIGKILLAGAWSEPLSGDTSQGGDVLGVVWGGTGSNAGLSVNALMPVPYFSVKRGSASVTGAARPNQKVKVTLRTKSGALRATGTARAKGPNGGFTVKLRHDGAAVKVRTGDKLTSSLYPGAKLTVVKADLAIDTVTGHVTGHCFEESTKVLAEARVGLATSTESLFTDIDRAFDLDASGLGLPLPSNATARAVCANAQGNELRLSATAS